MMTGGVRDPVDPALGSPGLNCVAHAVRYLCFQSVDP